jgi:DNA-directed RNA polymerase alpha subunit
MDIRILKFLEHLEDLNKPLESLYNSITLNEARQSNLTKSLEQTEYDLAELREKVKEFTAKCIVDKKLDEMIAAHENKENKQKEDILNIAVSEVIKKFVYDEYAPGYNYMRRTINSLRAEKIVTVSQLISHTDRYLLNIQNFGKLSLKLIKMVLEKHGLTLKEDNE